MSFPPRIHHNCFSMLLWAYFVPVGDTQMRHLDSISGEGHAAPASASGRHPGTTWATRSHLDQVHALPSTAHVQGLWGQVWWPCNFGPMGKHSGGCFGSRRSAATGLLPLPSPACPSCLPQLPLLSPTVCTCNSLSGSASHRAKPVSPWLFFWMWYYVHMLKNKTKHVNSSEGCPVQKQVSLPPWPHHPHLFSPEANTILHSECIFPGWAAHMWCVNVMVNVMCPLDWTTGGPRSWLNVISGVSLWGPFGKTLASELVDWVKWTGWNSSVEGLNGTKNWRKAGFPHLLPDCLTWDISLLLPLEPLGLGPLDVALCLWTTPPAPALGVFSLPTADGGAAQTP